VHSTQQVTNTLGLTKTKAQFQCSDCVGRIEADVTKTTHQNNILFTHQAKRSLNVHSCTG